MESVILPPFRASDSSALGESFTPMEQKKGKSMSDKNRIFPIYPITDEDTDV